MICHFRKCTATTTKGKECKNCTSIGSSICAVHERLLSSKSSQDEKKQPARKKPHIRPRKSLLLDEAKELWNVLQQQNPSWNLREVTKEADVERLLREADSNLRNRDQLENLLLKSKFPLVYQVWQDMDKESETESESDELKDEKRSRVRWRKKKLPSQKSVIAEDDDDNGRDGKKYSRVNKKRKLVKRAKQKAENKAIEAGIAKKRMLHKETQQFYYEIGYNNIDQPAEAFFKQLFDQWQRNKKINPEKYVYLLQRPQFYLLNQLFQKERDLQEKEKDRKEEESNSNSDSDSETTETETDADFEEEEAERLKKEAQLFWSSLKKLHKPIFPESLRKNRGWKFDSEEEVEVFLQETDQILHNRTAFENLLRAPTFKQLRRLWQNVMLPPDEEQYF